jgi:hypothetical protein
MENEINNINRKCWIIMQVSIKMATLYDTRHNNYPQRRYLEGTRFFGVDSWRSGVEQHG